LKSCPENPDVQATKGVAQVRAPRRALEEIADIDYEELPTGVNTFEAVQTVITKTLKKYKNKQEM